MCKEYLIAETTIGNRSKARHDGGLGEGWSALAVGIVKQAMQDYFDALYTLKDTKDAPLALRTISDVTRFFHSEWYAFLCNLDGDMLLRRIENMVEERYSPNQRRNFARAFTMDIEKKKV